MDAALLDEIKEAIEATPDTRLVSNTGDDYGASVWGDIDGYWTNVEATPDVPLETGPVGPYWTIAAFIDGTWNNDVLCGPDGRAYARLFANARRWLAALLDEVEWLQGDNALLRLEKRTAEAEARRLGIQYNALLKLEMLHQQVAAEKLGRLEAQRDAARELAGTLKQARDELAADLAEITKMLKVKAFQELKCGAEYEWDKADQVCLCPNCNSEMDLVRPGEWQCRKCELEEMLEKAREEGRAEVRKELAKTNVEASNN